MNIFYKIYLKNKNKKQYKNYIHDHKMNVLKAFYEMLECKELDNIVKNSSILYPLWLRVLEHDDSKYSKEEFEPYRKNFYPINQEEKEKNKEAFDKAWEHHYLVNDHHWQHRQNNKEEQELSTETKLACLENVLDWLAMGYQFNDRPYQYYEKNKDNIILPECQKKFIEMIIYEGIDKKFIQEEK